MFTLDSSWSKESYCIWCWHTVRSSQIFIFILLYHSWVYYYTIYYDSKHNVIPILTINHTNRETQKHTISSFKTTSLQASFGSPADTIKVQILTGNTAPSSKILSILLVSTRYKYGSSFVGCLDIRVKVTTCE